LPALPLGLISIRVRLELIIVVDLVWRTNVYSFVKLAAKKKLKM
jgi:hypothetical protein